MRPLKSDVSFINHFVQPQPALDQLYIPGASISDMTANHLHDIVKNLYDVRPLAMNVIDPEKKETLHCIEFMTNYLINRSFQLNEPGFTQAKSIQDFLTSLELDPATYKIFPGNKQVFKDNFFDSDYVKKSISKQFQPPKFYSSYIIECQWRQGFIDTGVCDFEHDETTWLTVVGEDGQKFALACKGKELLPYRDMQIWDFIWQILTFSQYIIELGDICLIDEAGMINTPFYKHGSVDSILEVLDSISRVPLVNKSLEVERAKFISIMRTIYNSFQINYWDHVHTLYAKYVETSRIQIDDLIASANSKSVKEVSNNYGW